MVSPNVQQELLKLEKRYWQAIKDQDAETAAKLSDDPCLVTGAQGVAQLGRDALMRMMKSANYTLHDFEMRNPQVRLIGDDVAILAYDVHEELTVDGKRVILDAADASTWVRGPKGWVCALHTESIAGDPFGRDRIEH
jgi:uncharacterized protein (TIGR02246 family)